MKGAILPDHIGVNKYQLLINGVAPLTLTEATGLEDELQTTELPDRTRASGGNRGPSEIEVKIPMHHLIEQAAMELWFKESQDPVAPTYRRAATLLHFSISGVVIRSYSLLGVFPSKRVNPDLEMANEGELALVTWTLSVDDILPL
jgi:hypothetical protein